MTPIHVTLSYAVLAVFIAYILYMLACRLIAHFKSLENGPVTLTPVIPFPQGNLQVFKGTQEVKNLVPDAKIQVFNGNTDEEKVTLSSIFLGKNVVYERINKFMASAFKLHSRLPDEYEVGKNSYRLKPKNSVPENARTISIKMDGYEHGEKCHDFLPIRKPILGHFTYQMYGNKRIQVTRHVADGKIHIAGFCIYIENPWLSQAEYRWDLLKNMARSIKITENPQLTEGNKFNQKKNEENPKENTKLISLEWTVKYCSKLRRKVMTSMDSGEDVVHQEWFHKKHQMKIEKCEECTKERLKNGGQQPT